MFTQTVPGNVGQWTLHISWECHIWESIRRQNVEQTWVFILKYFWYMSSSQSMCDDDYFIIGSRQSFLNTFASHVRDELNFWWVGALFIPRDSVAPSVAFGEWLRVWSLEATLAASLGVNGATEMFSFQALPLCVNRPLHASFLFGVIVDSSTLPCELFAASVKIPFKFFLMLIIRSIMCSSTHSCDGGGGPQWSMGFHGSSWSVVVDEASARLNFILQVVDSKNYSSWMIPIHLRCKHGS